ncbi:urease accessory protein UreF [Ramlibacter sp. G-1-2-2]|uniref:Urease accessory protein UreF n=1 Tax=Ramlibacter agri TaxID=2728837 RepID=A0A848GY77_9BURK|nr:urease accessory UreF family protein [Ramlibacter agri]NML43535.1 urease accessory protein UreF [Ramlibacter agri]
MSTTIMTTGMDTDTTTTLTDAALLRLTWLASPALPVGGFSYSEGLEAAVEAGLVRDEQSAGDWLVDQLHLALARGDLAVVAKVASDPQRAGEMDAWVRQTRETSEFRLQSEQMGKSLGDWAKSLGRAGVPAATQPKNTTYPVAYAIAAQGTPLRATLLAYAFGWSENMMQAAIKSVPLGQSAGQRILARLADEIPQAVAHALQAEPQAFTPMLAILSARHETQYSRLFRS